jgi:hypothetical protein
LIPFNKNRGNISVHNWTNEGVGIFRCNKCGMFVKVADGIKPDEQIEQIENIKRAEGKSIIPIIMYSDLLQFVMDNQTWDTTCQ